MRIFGMGWVELLIIVVVIALICGPTLFVRLGKRLKKTGDAAKKGIESGSSEAGHQIKLDELSKKDIADKIEEFQDKVDEKLTKAEKESLEDEKNESV